MDEQLAGLQTLTAARRSKLEESIQLHQYIRDVDEVMSWVKEKQSVASAEEYGKDFDHLLVSCLCSWESHTASGKPALHRTVNLSVQN